MSLLHPRTRAFFSHFARVYPAGTALMVALLVISGLLEGISVVTLVPLLEIATGGGAGGTSGIGSAISSAMLQVGIQPTLWSLACLVILGITLKAVILWLAKRQVGYTTARVTLDLRLQLVRALAQARWSYFGQQPIGEFANSISRDAVRSANAYREGCNVLGGVLQVATYLVVSALISWEATLAAIITGALLLFTLKRFIEMGRIAGDDALRLTRRLAARLVDALQGIKPMKAMAKEDFLWPLMEKEAQGLNRVDRETVIAAESIRLFQEPVVAAVLGFGLVLLLRVADMSFSAVLVLAFVFYRLMSNVNTLQSQYQQMVNGEGTFWALRQQIEDAEAAAERHSGTRIPTELNDCIELREVVFSYGEFRVLDSLDLRIPARKITALIGESGSGKSTIIDLITGLHRPSSGDVHVDGVKLAEIDLKSWRRLIGYVPQDVFLFHDTVRRNLTLGDASIGDERLLQALADAGALEFVMRDPQGLDAMVSPQASNLSGGQKQRLAIARALAKNPQLLILDEATSGLDSDTEAAILETLSALRGKVTMLAISHQPALRSMADVTILVERRQPAPAAPATA